MNLSLRIAPHVRLIKRLLLGPGSLETVASDIEVLCPEETAELRPPVFLPNQFERITATTQGRPVAAEIEMLTSRRVVHAPTIAYHLDGASLVGGSLYVGRYRYLLTKNSSSLADSGGPRHINVAALASTFLGVRFFGHWLVDDCTRYILCEQYGRLLCLSQTRPQWVDKTRYSDYFQQAWSPITNARFDRLIIFQDHGQNTLKASRYRKLRNQIADAVPAVSNGEMIYLKRGTTGVARLVADEGALLETLTRQGFKLLDLASSALDQTLGVLRGAKFVVSIEGSHIAHCAYAMPRGGGIVALQPEDQFTGVHRGWCDCLGIRFGGVVGRKEGGAYRFDVSEIIRTVDLMLRDT